MIFLRGISPGGITLVLDQQMNLKVHRTTVQRWADRYVGMVDRYTGGLRIRAGRKWSSDEKFVRVVGADHWVFTVMDTASRFVLSWDVSPDMMNHRTVHLLERAADRAGHIPLIFVTDRLRAFPSAFRRVFWRGRNPRPVHFRESHIRSRRCNNNCHERFNGTLSERLCTATASRGPTRRWLSPACSTTTSSGPLWGWAGSRPPGPPESPSGGPTCG